MSLSRKLHRQGIPSSRGLDSKPTITRAKPPRKANSYRGKRRNDCRDSVKGDKQAPVWTKIWGEGYYWFEAFKPNRIRQSFISKAMGKYMPHDGGKKFVMNLKKPLRGQPHKEMFRGFGGRNR